MNRTQKQMIGVFAAMLILAGTLITAYSKPYGEYRKAACEWCGHSDALNVHHFLPQHIRHDLRDNPTNLVTLCRDCHFVLGHKRNWTNSVPEIRVLFEKGVSP